VSEVSCTDDAAVALLLGWLLGCWAAFAGSLAALAGSAATRLRPGTTLFSAAAQSRLSAHASRISTTCSPRHEPRFTKAGITVEARAGSCQVKAFASIAIFRLPPKPRRCRNYELYDRFGLCYVQAGAPDSR
jgi:hypothetical protein